MVGVSHETAAAVSITFEPPAGTDFSYRPGQFLTLAVPSERTGSVARCYSLSSSPQTDPLLTVTVKRTVGGYASNWLCDHTREGSVIRSLPPSGAFTPPSVDTDLLLLGGGSGITPLVSILRTTLSCGSGQVALLFANRDERSVMFAPELARLAAAHPSRLQVVHWLDSVQDMATTAQLEAFCAPYAAREAFVCGPPAFMDAATVALRHLDVPRDRRHVERFVSLTGDPFGSAREVALAERKIEAADAPEAMDPPADANASDDGLTRLEVELDGRTHTWDDWAPTARLLDHLEAKGIAAPYSCREGECSSCAVRLLEGDVRMVRNEVLDADDLEDGIRLACQSLPLTDLVRVVYD